MTQHIITLKTLTLAIAIILGLVVSAKASARLHLQTVDRVPTVNSLPSHVLWSFHDRVT